MNKYLLAKKELDFFFALAILLTIWPLLLVITLLIKYESKGPVFYLQDRLGENGKVFRMYKFRTMIDGAINLGAGLRTEDGDPRITKVGNILRKTSLDELPQILNVLKGDMSFIGPRPPVPYYPRKYEEYSTIQLKRFIVKPGITGYAQIKVRNGATWDERILFDLEYVNKISLKFDLYIFFMTIYSVISKSNIYLSEDAKKAIPSSIKVPLESDKSTML